MSNWCFVRPKMVRPSFREALSTLLGRHASLRLMEPKRPIDFPKQALTPGIVICRAGHVGSHNTVQEKQTRTHKHARFSDKSTLAKQNREETSAKLLDVFLRSADQSYRTHGVLCKNAGQS